MRACLRLGAGIAAAICAAFVSAAAAQSTDPPISLRYLGSYPIHDKAAGLTEPSGLAPDAGTDGFWTVSDDTHHLFRLDGKGRVVEVGPKIDALVDPEGIALDTQRGRFLVLSEDHAEILALAQDSPETVERHQLLEMQGADKLARALKDDLGALSPEGITIDAGTGAVLVVNERAPRLLIRLSPDLDEIVSVAPLSGDDGFVVHGVSDHRLDSSGLFHDAARDALWIASDTGKCVFFWARGAGSALRFDLLWRDGDKVRPIHNTEGVALNASGEMLFVVSDDRAGSRLFIYGVE